jgi:hypothetical protein
MAEERALTRDGGINLPEGLGPFFSSVMEKSVAVSADGFTVTAPGGVFTRVMTRSPKYKFAVEMTRCIQEIPYDCSTVEARTLTQDDLHGYREYVSFIRRYRPWNTDETYASRTGGLYGNDMTDAEKEDFEREFLRSTVDVELTSKWYEYFRSLFIERDNDGRTQIEWPMQGIGIVVEQH